MKFKWDKRYLYWGITAFAVIAACTILFIVLSNYEPIVGFFTSLLGILTPVAIAFIIAYLLAPLCSFFEKSCFRKLFFKIDRGVQHHKSLKNPDYHRKNNCSKIRRLARGIAVFATLILALLICTALIWAVLPQLVVTIQTLISNLPSYIDEGNKLASSLLEDYPDIRSVVTEFINNIYTNLTDWLANSLLPQVTNIVDTVSNGVMGIVSAFLNVLIGFVISIYFLYNKELFAAQLKKILYGFFSIKSTNRFLRNVRHIHKVFGSFITGKLIDSLIIGLLFFIVLTIFNFPYALLVSIIMGICNIIPYFGPFIGAAPSTLLILLENPLYALYFIIIVVVIQQLDGNVIAPKIIGDSTGLSSFWVIFALLLGQGIFGFWGLIIGIPLFAVIYSFTKERVKKRLESRGLPTESKDYEKIGYINAETHNIISVHQMNADERRTRTEARAKEQAERKKKRRFNFSNLRKKKSVSDDVSADCDENNSDKKQ